MPSDVAMWRCGGTLVLVSGQLKNVSRGSLVASSTPCGMITSFRAKFCNQLCPTGYISNREMNPRGYTAISKIL